MNNQRNQQLYWCPTHPEVTSTDPNAICTKCGTMKLIPKKPTKSEGGKSLSQKRTLKDFLPLILIFGSIILFTVLMQLFIGKSDVDFGMRMFMGAFFFIFGAFKVVNLKKFAEAYSTYDIVAKRSRFYALLYPFLELAFAALYFADFGGIVRDLIVFTVMTVSTIGVVQKLRLREEIPCACLGMVFVLPMTWVTLTEDILMALEALLMILMPIGFHIISLENIDKILDLSLVIHNSQELVAYSQLGHWVLGGILLWFVISTLLDRFARKNKLLRVVQYTGPSLIIFFGLALSLLDLIVHGLDIGFATMRQLLSDPTSQWFQHFAGGLLMVFAGISEIVRMKTKNKLPFVRYGAPLFIFLTGVMFFFHQQLGALDAVVFSMTWHMIFGGLLIVGSVMRMLDILLFEERKGFFWIWVVALVIGAGMMITYREPHGAYEPASQEQKIEFQQDLEMLKEKWSLI